MVFQKCSSVRLLCFTCRVHIYRIIKEESILLEVSKGWPCRFSNKQYFFSCKTLQASSCSFHTFSLKRCAQYNTDICTADCRDILYVTTVILVPNIIKDFQSILVLKGCTGIGFFKFIFYWYEFFVIFLFPLLLAPKSISYFTDEETV